MSDRTGHRRIGEKWSKNGDFEWILNQKRRQPRVWGWHPERRHTDERAVSEANCDESAKELRHDLFFHDLFRWRCALKKREKNVSTSHKISIWDAKNGSKNRQKMTKNWQKMTKITKSRGGRLYRAKNRKKPAPMPRRRILGKKGGPRPI